MKNWKRFFRPHILERGFDYALDDAVLSVKETKSGYRAIVSGSENYDVLIETVNGKIQSMECSCPYADSGNYCKHMAAVLFVLTDDDLDDEDDDYDNEDWLDYDQDEFEEFAGNHIDEYDLQEYIAEFSLEEARNLLFEISKSDHHIAEKVIVASEKLERKHRIIRIFENDKNDLFKRINGFLDDEVVDYIKRNDTKFAIELLCDILLQIDEKMTEMDFSNIIGRSFELMTSAIENTSDNFKYEMIISIKKMTDSLKNESLLNLCDDFIRSTDKLNPKIKKLHELDSLIQKAGKCSKCPEVIGNNFQLIEAVLYRIELMKELGYTQDDIVKYRDEMRHFSVIRCMEIQEALSQNKVPEALFILSESKKIDCHDKALLYKYNEYSIEAYRMMNDNVNLVREMKSMILHAPQVGMSKVIELRNMMNQKEWNDFLPKLLKSSSIDGIRMELMIEEGMKEEVFQQIESYHQFLKYEDDLKQLDLLKAQAMLIDFLEDMAKQASKREEYRNLFYQLMKLAYYPGGHDEIYRIAQKWKIMYKKRSAMMEELSFAFRKWTFLKKENEEVLYCST